MHVIVGITALERLLDFVEPKKICVLLEVDRNHNFDDSVKNGLNVDKMDKLLWKLETVVNPIPEFQTGLVYRNEGSSDKLTSRYSFLDPSLSWNNYRDSELFLVLRPNWDLEAFLGEKVSMELLGRIHGMSNPENSSYVNIWIGSL